MQMVDLMVASKGVEMVALMADKMAVRMAVY
jgi:hypothetical protein